MKKKLFIGIGIFIAVLLFAFCFSDSINNFIRKDSKRYALCLYGENFHYTRGLEARYDKSGKLESIEVYLIYDNSAFEIAGSGKDPAEKYPEAKATYVMNDDGSVKITNFLTAKSIEAGALEDNAFYMVNSIYDKVETEDQIKLFLEEQKEFAKENNIPADGTNYIIMNGKNVKW